MKIDAAHTKNAKPAQYSNFVKLVTKKYVFSKTVINIAENVLSLVILIPIRLLRKWIWIGLKSKKLLP